MKRLLTLVLSMTLAPTFSGGISVGSGQGKVVVGLSVEGNFPGETILMRQAQSLIGIIEAGQSKRLNHMRRIGECNQSFSKIEELDIAAFYPLDKDGLAHEKVFVGYLTVELKDCKAAQKIEIEDRFGWDELWD